MVAKSSPLGSYNVTITLTDDNEDGSLSSEYDLEVVVTAGENSPPVFDNLDFEMAFIVPSVDLGSISGIPFPYVIKLGAVSDPEEDFYIVWFDNLGNDFITFDSTTMTLSVDPTADPGSYNCTILLSDLNVY